MFTIKTEDFGPEEKDRAAIRFACQSARFHFGPTGSPTPPFGNVGVGMKLGVPWRVKGIRAQDARETAREAARRDRVSVGEWLNTVILNSADEEGVRPSRPGYDDGEDDNDQLFAVQERLDELNSSDRSPARRVPVSRAPYAPAAQGPEAYAPPTYAEPGAEPGSSTRGGHRTSRPTDGAIG